MEPFDEDTTAALAAFVRRRPHPVGLSPMEVLAIVTRDGFKCRVCDADVEAHPRAVLRLELEGAESEQDRLITVCDSCRLELLGLLSGHSEEGEDP